jgi:hypothetical protein
VTEPRDSYSPERRTALLLTGTGADGAYHAGALRALHEAGVKLDIVGGRGIGVLGALLSAVDGGSELWETNGFWRSPAIAALYRWRWPLRLVRILFAALLAVFAIPIAVVVFGLLLYPVALVLGMAGLDAGAHVFQGYLYRLADAFSPEALPTWIPRLAAIVAAAGLLMLAVGGALTAWRAPLRRRSSGSPAWALLGSPIDAAGAIERATNSVWRLLKGGAVLKTPEPRDLSRRYAERVHENVGQPGFRELLLVVHDLDARRDMIFGFLREPYRKMLFPPPGAVSSRRAEAQDLASGPQNFAVDVLAAALSLPGVTDPRLVRFAPDSYWRGETHRLIDRPSSIGRLLEEAAAAGAEQVVIISASPQPPGPHELRPSRRDAFGKLGEQFASAEASALADAIRHLHHRFQGVCVIRPEHNPIRALDFTGAYDERSDRVQSLDELMERGYEDAYRQFVEPVLGASGDRIG